VNLRIFLDRTSGRAERGADARGTRDRRTRPAVTLTIMLGAQLMIIRE